jgi:mxaL protein
VKVDLPRLKAALRGRRDTVLLATAALLLLACLLRPSLPVQRALFEHVVMIDITQSMNVADLQLDGQPVSRLAYARAALRASLLQLPCGSRVGLGLFTEYRSFLLLAPVEVCDNLQELRSTLEHIDGRLAWTGNSEVAKGLISGIGIAAQLPGHPSLVFVTDGHEAPPLNPRHRQRLDGKPGEVQGLVVGVGGLLPMPIPKTDPSGRPLGYWAADEVMQTDPRSQGRGGSVGGEAMADDGSGAPVPDALRGGAKGSEHLSSLREGYLRLLAGETGLAYLRLDGTEGLLRALTAETLARPVPAQADLRVPLALLALGLLAWRHAPAALWRRFRRA